MKQWYYKVGDEERGPVTQEDLAGMLARKEISPDTLVRGPDVEEWTALHDLEPLQEPMLDPQPEAPRVNLEEDRNPYPMPKTRPWARFVGRMFDYCIFALLLGYILAILGLSFDRAPFGILLVPFLWIFVEACLLSVWGATPGKWMVQTCVRLKNGHKLTFRDALARSFSVWWLGIGAGIPIIAFVTMIVAATKLSNTGSTSWDRQGKFTVTYNRIGPLRAVALILFFFALFWGVLPFFIDVS